MATCEVCGKDAPEGKRFCCRSCSNRSRRTGETRSCAQCGTSFYMKRCEVESPSHTGQYCSQQCFGLARRTGKTFRCEECGADFYRYPSAATHPNRTNQYCSAACYDKNKPKHYVDRTYPADFGARVSRGKKNRANGQKTQPVPFDCEACGQTAVPDRSTHSYAGRRFCSHACRTRAKLASPLGAGGSNKSRGPNWPTQAELARERDSHTCQDCGRHRERPGLAVHHLRAFHEFAGDYETANRLDNLLTLCDSCHARRHAI